jgi:hypothetical protein
VREGGGAKDGREEGAHGEGAVARDDGAREEGDGRVEHTRDESLIRWEDGLDAVCGVVSMVVFHIK